jgi:hypothetical protein
MKNCSLPDKILPAYMIEEGESLPKKARKPVGRKTLGVVYVFIALLIILVGYIAHLTNSVNFSLQMPDDVLEFAISQIDLYFIEYVIVGFFTGVFLVLGIAYIGQRRQDNAQHS